MEQSDLPPTRKRFPNSRASCEQVLRGDLPADWDKDIPSFPAGRQRHGHTRRIGEGDERHRAARAGVDRRLGGSRSVDLHRAQGLGDFEPPGASARDRQGSRGRRLELCGPQSALRRARARDGRDPERSGRAWRNGAVRRDVPDLLRLHAAADAPRRADGTARDLRVHARQHCTGRGRLDASTGRTARGLAFGSASHRHPALRRQRDRRRLARRTGNARPAGGVDIDAPARADARSRAVCRRRWPAARRVRTGRCAERRNPI